MLRAFTHAFIHSNIIRHSERGARKHSRIGNRKSEIGNRKYAVALTLRPATAKIGAFFGGSARAIPFPLYLQVPKIMAGEGLGWRAQLTQMRETVLEMEKRRETEKRLERERNEQSLTVKLKTDTAEALAQRYQDIQKKFDRDARRFYPLPYLEAVVQEVTDLTDLLVFYADCMKLFPKVFSPSHKTGIPALINDLATLQKGLDRQLGQWREVKEQLNAATFRARADADNAALVAAAKSFSDRAHSVPLHIPGDYFGHEGANFWSVAAAEKVYGYVKFWPADKVLTFALAPEPTVNFNKFVRGVLHKFCTAGPLPQPLPAVRVNITFAREAKFFTDMGFTRVETKGPSEWIYQREV